MPACLIALGSNLGDRAETLARAIELLRAEEKIDVVAVSRWHVTQPVGGPAAQGEYLNGAALVETSLSPHELLAALLRIEAALGRQRGERWAARTLDLDLLLYDELSIDTPDLVVPHPRMTSRHFVLAPAAEIAPEMRHPTTGLTISELLARLDKPPD